jgi:hypothetical protein
VGEEMSDRRGEVQAQTKPRWIKCKDRLPKRGRINPANTAPKKYFLLHAYGRVEWEVMWIDLLEEYQIVAWCEASVPPIPRKFRND